MLRRPTDEELDFINSRLAQDTLKKEECYILDGGAFANDFMETQYGYYLSTGSLMNFINDLQNTIPLQINHGGSYFLPEPRILPLGAWFNGSIETVMDRPPEARAGKNMKALGNLFMPVGLEFNGYNTDHIAKGYRAGTVKALSIGQDWSKASFICDICGKNILDAEECSHIPGRLYDGVKCTFTVDNSHLKEISIVWAGALPLAELGDRTTGHMIPGKIDWESIKRNGMTAENLAQISILSGSFVQLEFKKEAKDMAEMTFDKFLQDFASELSELYVKKDIHNELKDNLESTQGELTALADRFGIINTELEASKDFIAIGKKRLEELTAEYHRLGVALNGDKWNEESENDLLSGMVASKRIEYLASKNDAMADGIKKNLEKQEVEVKNKKQYTHRDNPALYKTRK